MKNDIAKFVLKQLRGELRKRKRRKTASPVIIAVLVVSIFGLSQYLEEGDAPLPGKGVSLSCSIKSIYDGDTVTASCPDGQLKIRIWGIDAPEIGQKPWGTQSRDVLRELAPSQIRVEVVDTDRYGRVVARLYAAEKDLGLTMVQQGRAIVYERYNQDKTYKVAQTEAKWDKRGIWAKPGAQQDPEAWRRLNPRS